MSRRFRESASGSRSPGTYPGGDGILGSSGLPKLISGHILSPAHWHSYTKVSSNVAVPPALVFVWLRRMGKPCSLYA
jgi:hypothetical protein